MGCIIAVLMFLSPRFVLFFMQVFSDRLSIAFNSFLIGFAGFVFLPYTTVLYAICYAPDQGVSGIGWLLVLFGFFLDMGSWFGGGKQARQRQTSAA
ncbi:MAG: hypothetical protein WD029_05380 [Microthrixaceae bacterium]